MYICIYIGNRLRRRIAGPMPAAIDGQPPRFGLSTCDAMRKTTDYYYYYYYYCYFHCYYYYYNYCYCYYYVYVYTYIYIL